MYFLHKCDPVIDTGLASHWLIWLGFLAVQATSIGDGLRSAVDLINPVSLFRFSSVLVIAKEKGDHL